MDWPVQRNPRRRVSFETLSLRVGPDPMIYRIGLRYPHDIPQGTAIPRWAFFNVTVCHKPALLSIEQGDLTPAPPLQESTEPDLQRYCGYGRRSYAWSFTLPLGAVLMWSGLGYPEATPRIIETASGKPDPTGSGDSSDGGSRTGAIAGGKFHLSPVFRSRLDR